MTPLEKADVALEAIITGNNSKVGRKYGRDESTIRDWIDKFVTEGMKLKLQDKISKTNKRKRSPKFLLLEVKLILDLVEQRKLKQQVSQKYLQKKAIEIFNDLQKQNIGDYKKQTFQASNGWFENFSKRWKISYRKQTHILTTLSLDIYLKIETFLKEVYSYRIEQTKQGKSLIMVNFDEIPVYFDMTNDRTFDFERNKSIEIAKSTGTKQRLTAIVGVSSLGYIFPPLLIFKSNQKQKIFNQYEDQSIATHNKNGWSTREVYLAYMESVLSNIQLESETQIVLFHDKFSGHRGEMVEDWAKENNLKIFELPEGSTFLLQVIDTIIGKKFKGILKEYQQQWLSDQIKNIHASSQTNKKINPPRFEQIIEWSVKSLQQFPIDKIKQGFTYSGLIMNLNTPLKQQLNPQLYDQEVIRKSLEQILLDSNDNIYSEKPYFKEIAEKNDIKSSYEVESNIESLITNNFTSKQMTLSSKQEEILETEIFIEFDEENETQTSDDENEEFNIEMKQEKIDYKDKLDINLMHVNKENQIKTSDNFMKHTVKNKNFNQIYYNEFNKLISSNEDKKNRKDKPKSKNQSLLTSFYKKV
ncbi:hypothetical protein ABPG72_021736 [Tetrahymena utriculariae]